MNDEILEDSFLLSKKQCSEFIKEAALHEQLIVALLKNYDVLNLAHSEKRDLLKKLCEYYMCNAGIRDLLEDFEASRPSQYNEEHEDYDYIVTVEDSRNLQLIIIASDVLKMELEDYNISFTVH